MSLFGLPATRMFWSHSSRIAHVADVMPLARWEAIKIFLHFSDNSCQPTRYMTDYDELYKIWTLLNHIRWCSPCIPCRQMGQRPKENHQCPMACSSIHIQSAHGRCRLVGFTDCFMSHQHQVKKMVPPPRLSFHRYGSGDIIQC